MKAIDLTGKTIGYAYVNRLEYRSSDGSKFWNCTCLYNGCGNTYIRSQVRLLRHKEDANCGCLCKKKAVENKIDAKSIRKLPHGLRIDEIYHGMSQRCYNPNHEHYSNYGGRGITICDEWKQSKRKFYDWAMANGYRDDLTIDRIDVDKAYSPQNCRWVDYVTQGNNKRNIARYEYKGELLTVAEIARKVNIRPGLIHSRLKRGLDIEQACYPFSYHTKKSIIRTVEHQ